MFAMHEIQELSRQNSSTTGTSRMGIIENTPPQVVEPSRLGTILSWTEIQQDLPHCKRRCSLTCLRTIQGQKLLSTYKIWSPFCGCQPANVHMRDQSLTGQVPLVVLLDRSLRKGFGPLKPLGKAAHRRQCMDSALPPGVRHTLTRADNRSKSSTQ